MATATARMTAGTTMPRMTIGASTAGTTTAGTTTVILEYARTLLAFFTFS
jgi:hypothetical protein